MARPYITVLNNTRLKDLKVGDTVITGELMRIVKIEKKEWTYDKVMLHVTHIKPQCCKGKCGHVCIKGVGWGQQKVQKVISR